MRKTGLNFAVIPQVSEAYLKSTPKKGFAYLSHISRKTAPPSAPRTPPGVCKFPTKGALVQSAPHKAPAGAGPDEPPRRRGQGGGEGSPRAPAPHRGPLTDVPLDGDLLDASPLGAGRGRRAEPLRWGGHA